MLNLKFSAVVILSFLFGAVAQAFDFKVSPVGRVRFESLSNYDLNASSGDYKSFTGSRFWFMTELTQGDYQIVFQPQFSRTWGLDEAAGASSGGTIDPSLNVHQAFFMIPLAERFKLKLGRLELSYGDELVLGSVIWSNVGRSFDAIKMEWKMGSSQLDVFSSKLSDRNYSSPSPGDKDLHGVYFSGRNELSLFREVDVYLLDVNDSTANPHIDILAYGLRSKGSYDFFDYRFEGTKQRRNSSESSQVDLEVGFELFQTGRWAMGYFAATEGYNQLFPTAHKWLGIGDVVSRRNIQGYQLRHNFQFNEKVKTEVTYHYFDRYSNESTAFSFSGAPLGNVSSRESKIGDEYDVVINYAPDGNLSYQLGAAWFLPGKYLKESGQEDEYTFVYLQLLLKL